MTKMEEIEVLSDARSVAFMGARLSLERIEQLARYIIDSDIDTMKDDLGKLNDECEELKEEHTSLTEEHEELEKEHTSLERAHKELKEEHKALKKEHESLYELVKLLEAELVVAVG